MGKPTIAELEAILNQPNSPQVNINPDGSIGVGFDLRKEIERAINCTCAENGSNTPDFILAEFMTDCLAAFDKASNRREQWYGKGLRIGGEVRIEPETGRVIGEQCEAEPSAVPTP